MAEFRVVYTKIWRDAWFSTLDAEGRVLWIYLVTNPAASVAGIYRLPDMFIAFDTGIAPERVTALKEQFRDAGRIDYEGDVIWVLRMRDYQETHSAKVAARIAKDLDEIPDGRIKRLYCQKYGIGIADPPTADKVSIPMPQSAADTDTEKEKETEKDTDTGPSAPPAPPPAAVLPAGDLPAPDLSVSSITHGTELQAKLESHFAGLRRPHPAWTVFDSVDQRNAFDQAAATLNGEFLECVQAGLDKSLRSRAALLGWLRGCVQKRARESDRVGAAPRGKREQYRDARRRRSDDHGRYWDAQRLKSIEDNLANPPPEFTPEIIAQVSAEAAALRAKLQRA